MPKFTVHMKAYAWTSITVEAADYDEAIEAAYEEGTPTICAQCSGWGSDQNLDLSEFEADEVTNEDHETVWKDKT